MSEDAVPQSFGTVDLRSVDIAFIISSGNVRQ